MSGETEQQPSGWTTDTLLAHVRAMLAAERDHADAGVHIIAQRLDGMDTATRLLSETVTRVPTAVQEAVSHLKELHGERFDSIAQMFVSRDTAVAAAFDAQKEAAAAQQQANREAIQTNQQMTADLIRNLAAAQEKNYGTLAEKIDDLKDRVNDRESRGRGEADVKTDQRSVLTLVATLISVAILVAAFIIANKP